MMSIKRTGWSENENIVQKHLNILIVFVVYKQKIQIPK